MQSEFLPSSNKSVQTIVFILENGELFSAWLDDSIFHEFSGFSSDQVSQWLKSS